MVDTPWGPLPLSDLETPKKGGKYVDIEAINALIQNATINSASITGTITVADSIILGTGGVFTTGTSGAVISLTATDSGTITFESGATGEEAPGYIFVNHTSSTVARLSAEGSYLGDVGGGNSGNGSWSLISDETTPQGFASLIASGQGTWDALTRVWATASGSGDGEVNIAATSGSGTAKITLDAGRLYGTALDWKTWTPTYANITVGNGTVTARYIQIGDTVHCYFELVFGSTTTIAASATISAPVTASSSYPAQRAYVGPVRMEESGVATTTGIVRLESTTTLRPIVTTASTSYTQESGVTSTVPFTWGTADRLFFSATYEAA